jgi:hypothetical protein
MHQQADRTSVPRLRGTRCCRTIDQRLQRLHPRLAKEVSTRRLHREHLRGAVVVAGGNCPVRAELCLIVAAHRIHCVSRKRKPTKSDLRVSIDTNSRVRLHPSIRKLWTQRRGNHVRTRNCCAIFMVKIIILPRQARDKHRENSKKWRFLICVRKEMQIMQSGD